jgi:hypothetical protein
MTAVLLALLITATEPPKIRLPTSMDKFSGPPDRVVPGEIPRVPPGGTPGVVLR